MAITFEFTVGEGFHFSKAFAGQFNARLEHDRVWLPNMLGNGFIQETFLNNGLSLCLHSYTLKQPLVLRRHISSTQAAADFLTLRFDRRRMSVSREGQASLSGHEMELSTSNLFGELTVPDGQDINFLVITANRKDLIDLLHLDADDKAIATILKENKSFLLHEQMTAQIEKKLEQLSRLKAADKLLQLRYLTKALELIYLFFEKLLTRDINTAIAINQADADKIYEVRNAILNKLDTPPQLAVLARQTGMSQTKMKVLFRQVFGDSIYNYFQSARMNEAATLLNHMTVSETGYKLGFANLSHFARLFEKHFLMKPKKYQEALKRQLVATDND
jgi:AraC-like DNA-binding protein